MSNLNPCSDLTMILDGFPGEGESALDEDEEEASSSEAAGDSSEEGDVDMAGADTSDDMDDDQGPPGPTGRGGSTIRGGTKRSAGAAGISGGEGPSPPREGWIVEASCCQNPIILSTVAHARAIRGATWFCTLAW